MALFSFLKKKRSITLVLGGGSARGIAHIGVLKVLERERIPIDMIVGTSMGALIGASYALGISLDHMEKIACAFTTNKLLDPAVPRMGLLAGKRLEAVVKEITENKGFSDCRIPLAVVATDIERNEEIVYREGDLSKVIRASCSWPGIFNPVRIDGRLMVDGGVKNSVPTKIAKELNSDYILAVDVGFCVKRGKIENIFQMILQSFQIMGHELNKYQAREADGTIEVDLGDIDQTAFNRARESIKIGYAAAEAQIGSIKESLGI